MEQLILKSVLFHINDLNFPPNFISVECKLSEDKDSGLFYFCSLST